MNIVYTINGEGMGHASRSAVVIEYLLSQGHEVRIFASGKRPLQYLRDRFSHVTEVMGIHMVYRDNKVYRLRTAFRTVTNITDVRKDFVAIKKSLASFKPAVVITDYDFHGQIVAALYHIPVISLDNIQFITQADFEVAPDDFIDYELNYLVSKMMVPHADYFLITSFVKPELRNPNKKNVFFVPPLLRSKILKAKVSKGKHILAYQTTTDSYRKLLPLLAQSKEHYIVYNSGARSRYPNIICKDFNEDIFIQDLASSKAVITNGGFNVIVESLFFRKPILSIPIANFYEQKLNGLLLQKYGMGMMVSRLSKAPLHEFLRRLSRYEKESPGVEFDNTVVFTKLDSILKSLH